jgi:hypothetical protein
MIIAPDRLTADVVTSDTGISPAFDHLSAAVS